MRKIQYEFGVISIIILVSLGLLLGPVQPLLAQTQSICAKQLADAEQKYTVGRFDEAIKVISDCLGKPGLSEQEKMQAYRLLGLSYLAMDYLKEAKSAVQKLVDMVPNYQPDLIQDKPQFIKLVEEVKKEQAPVTKKEVIKPEKEKPIPEELLKAEKVEHKGGYKKWIWIGAGVVTVGVIAAFLIQPAPEKKPLPSPPSLP